MKVLKNKRESLRLITAHFQKPVQKENLGICIIIDNLYTTKPKYN